MAKICFVSLSIYPLLQRGSSFRFMGGAELQQVILAESLKNAGHEASFVTCVWDGREEDENLEDMEVFKAYDVKKGVPILRFFYPRSYKIWTALKRADADVYYQRGASWLTGIVALFCRINKKIFLFSGAHDRNFMIKKFPVYRLEGLIASINWRIYLMGLKSTCNVLVQSSRQKEWLRKNYNMESIVFENLYPRRELTQGGRLVLWVGTIKEIKRPLLFLEMARRMSEYSFVMIGGSSFKDPQYYDAVKKKSEEVPNLRFLGFQPLEITEQYFDKAGVFVNTAEMEGFPNTFLQAWSRGIPTIAFLDIDDVVQKNRLGAVVPSLDEMECQIKNWMNIPENERIRIQGYFEEKHSVERNGVRFATIIKDLLELKCLRINESVETRLN